MIEGTHILRIWDSAVIPMDETNSDYKEYLDWLALGNTPEPADIPDTSLQERIDDSETKLRSIPDWSLWELQTALDSYDTLLPEVTDLPSAKLAIEFQGSVIRKLIQFVYVYRDKLYPNIME